MYIIELLNYQQNLSLFISTINNVFVYTDIISEINIIYSCIILLALLTQDVTNEPTNHPNHLHTISF